MASIDYTEYLILKHRNAFNFHIVSYIIFTVNHIFAINIFNTFYKTANFARVSNINCTQTCENAMSILGIIGYKTENCKYNTFKISLKRVQIN